jgi:3-keto-5-aminohexanoate cleavage enzyme
VQLSTGAGLEVPYEERMKIVEARPAMATLNVATMTFASGEFRNPPDGMRKLAARMQELGVKPELEIYDHGHLDIALGLLKEGLLVEPLQFSIVLGVYGGAAATAANLVALVDRLPETAVWQVIGIGRQNLALTTIGLAMGGNARTGMEDTLMVRRGQPASGNAELVQRLAGIAKAIEREPATVEQAKQMLGLN